MIKSREVAAPAYDTLCSSAEQHYRTDRKRGNYAGWRFVAAGL
jgi:hypothetical protein